MAFHGTMSPRSPTQMKRSPARKALTGASKAFGPIRGAPQAVSRQLSTCTAHDAFSAASFNVEMIGRSMKPMHEPRLPRPQCPSACQIMTAGAGWRAAGTVQPCMCDAVAPRA
eukprot:5197971-Prymnesium_polylepis.2